MWQSAGESSNIQNLPLTYEDEKYPNSRRVLNDVYEICQVIGKGSFGMVISAFTRTPDRKKVAIKIIDKRPLKKMNVDFNSEAKILNQLSHPNIIRFFTSFESSQTYILVMEYFEGVSLEKFIEDRRETPFSDTQVRQIMENILQAIHHMHHAEVLHRDLKPENILIRTKNKLSTQTPKSSAASPSQQIKSTKTAAAGDSNTSEEEFEIKIIDFGLSYKNEFDSEGSRIGGVNDNCGTLIFMAPEIAFNRQYQRSVDIWSCGIIQFMLFSMGTHPLWKKGDDRTSFLEKLKAPAWNFPSSMNEKARSFFLKTSALKVEDRMTAMQCLKHVWISQAGNLDDPITMHEILACFQNKETLIRIIKSAMILTHLKRSIIAKGFIVNSPEKQSSTQQQNKSLFSFRISNNNSNSSQESTTSQQQLAFFSQPFSSLPLVRNSSSSLHLQTQLSNNSTNSATSTNTANATAAAPTYNISSATLPQKTLPKKSAFNSFEISSTSSEFASTQQQYQNPQSNQSPAIASLPLYHNPIRKYSNRNISNSMNTSHINPNDFEKTSQHSSSLQQQQQHSPQLNNNNASIINSNNNNQNNSSNISIINQSNNNNNHNNNNNNHNNNNNNSNMNNNNVRLYTPSKNNFSKKANPRYNSMTTLTPLIKQSINHDVFFSSLSEIQRLHQSSVSISAQSSPVKLPPITNNQGQYRSPVDSQNSQRNQRGSFSSSLSPQLMKAQKQSGTATFDKLSSKLCSTSSQPMQSQQQLQQSQLQSQSITSNPGSSNHITMKSHFYKEQSKTHL